MRYNTTIPGSTFFLIGCGEEKVTFFKNFPEAILLDPSVLNLHNSGPFLRLSKITGSEGDSERKVTFPVVWASDGRVAGQEWLNRCGSLVSRRGFRRYRGKLVRSVFGLSRAFGPGLRKQKFERTGR
ncbi:hypothetical protein CR083_06275 [Salmonella enterica subsp. enterica serovar Typhimurium]|uniref:Uncharacterized protein n=10 Tax=Enterobacteriaceae TaxID=543 RepID=A0A172CMP3_ECOLX|nr:hypothetical protein APECO1_O1R167 [Escherichia coli APEC O1]AKT72392.1 hypothetical protein [Escherichia coli]APZ80208.1 hypothetical protein [Salmonella enterica subsp. enterica serovar Typhimurium]AQM75499.1 hypothetical protein [Klebsiella pneumoniae]ASF62738.1 uncharacterized protein B0X74_01135 [Salmonella enterica subsp. enterica serovar Typhimurium var. monophasic 4,5,12:i:-]ASQ28685.1 hypothetical protein B6N51_25205 [Salmonella enterica subsp. enterica]OUD12780.1 hypothetical pro